MKSASIGSCSRRSTARCSSAGLKRCTDGDSSCRGPDGSGQTVSGWPTAGRAFPTLLDIGPARLWADVGYISDLPFISVATTRVPNVDPERFTLSVRAESRAAWAVRPLDVETG